MSLCQLQSSTYSHVIASSTMSGFPCDLASSVYSSIYVDPLVSQGCSHSSTTSRHQSTQSQHHITSPLKHNIISPVHSITTSCHQSTQAQHHVTSPLKHNIMTQAPSSTVRQYAPRLSLQKVLSEYLTRSNIHSIIILLHQV